ncbi:uncharacterized protein BYT42DRAFT_581852 [Radiomyces spectabilis]|uniref:uncharacterized protein n=1 Tax=Radiomyces spectabilis TaxID=64574 RepID=UPI00221FBDCF|nr:uncharacterized protein BYT42DRAFT_581852 [Radiomyces spectabilis]KAI8370330.1 hypothetical protein BYT42DRAFT_581852 [Radiomyces spectabilis]
MARITALCLSMMALFSMLKGADAHFQLTYPQTRGMDHAKEPTAPCGSFDSVGPRTEFPLSGGFVEINAGHPQYQYSVKVLVNGNPTASDFSGDNLKEIASGQRNYPQQACLPVDFSKVSDAKNGANATLQIIFNGGDGELYQCSDVTLVDNAPNFNKSMCINADGSKPSETSGDSGNNSNNGQSGASSLTLTSGAAVLAAVAAALSLA